MMKTLCVSVLLCLSVACSGGSSAPSSPDVWAVVDGREIRRDAVEKAYRRVAPPNATASEEEKTTAKLGLLNEMIVQDILVAKATALSIQVTDNDVDNAYLERKKNMPEDAFQKELNMRGLTIEDMKAGLRRELLADKVVEREVTSKVAVTDQEITDYFNSHKAQFNLAEPAWRIAQIVVTPVRTLSWPTARATTPRRSRPPTRKLQMLLTQLQGGADFGELAMDYSEDPQTRAPGRRPGLCAALPAQPGATAPARLGAQDQSRIGEQGELRRCALAGARGGQGRSGAARPLHARREGRHHDDHAQSADLAAAQRIPHRGARGCQRHELPGPADRAVHRQGAGGVTAARGARQVSPQVLHMKNEALVGQ